MKRNIIRIDEDKCNGCGLCVPSCHEGAISIVNGKARLAADSLCDGLGACLGECPQGAIVIEEREAKAFSEEDVMRHKQSHVKPPEACGCPGSMTQDFRGKPSASGLKPEGDAGILSSQLQQWPVQLRLLNPRAPFLKDADLVVSADCVPFTYPDFHRKFLKGKALAVFCPKLDEDPDEYVDKLAEIFRENNIRSVTMLRMEVPCCGGTVSIVEDAVRQSGKNVIMKEYTLSLRGEII